MKIYTSTTAIQEAAELLDIRTKSKELAKREKLLKSRLAARLGDEANGIFGSILVSITNLERSSVDSKALMAYVGLEVYESFKVSKPYQKMDVKAV